jgi:uncharacterized protein with HEPN domain
MRDDGVYLRHILDAIGKIESYVAVGRDVFMSTSHWQDAVIRQLEIVGEATKNLSRDLRSRHPDIPWRRIAGLRDILIHDYMGVRLAAVWEVTQTDLPILKKQIRNILDESGSGHDQR